MRSKARSVRSQDPAALSVSEARGGLAERERYTEGACAEGGLRPQSILWPFGFLGLFGGEGVVPVKGVGVEGELGLLEGFLLIARNGHDFGDVACDEDFFGLIEIF